MRVFYFFIIALCFIACGGNGAKKDSIMPNATKNTESKLETKKDSIESNLNPTLDNLESKTQKDFNKQLQDKMQEYKSKCDKKNGDFCVKLAITLQSLDQNNELEIKNLYQKAANYLQNDCDKGDMHACSGLGILYESGDGVVKSREKSKLLYEKSCENKDARGCLSLGLMINSCLVCKAKSNTESKKAIFYFNKACEYGATNACQIAQKLTQDLKE